MRPFGDRAGGPGEFWPYEADLRVQTGPSRFRPGPKMQTPAFGAGVSLGGSGRGGGAGGGLAAAVALGFSGAARLRPLDRAAFAVLVDLFLGPRALVRPGHPAGRES